ncbi:MAG: hypothetical protein ACRD3W_16385, partial [Terriglobales bacterium]
MMILLGVISGLLLVFVIIPSALYGVGHFVHEERRIAHALFKRMTWFYAGALVVALLVGIVFGIRGYLGYKAYMSMKQISTVSEEAARQETWQPTFVSVGNLDPVQGADISNQVAGNVAAIN